MSGLVTVIRGFNFSVSAMGSHWKSLNEEAAESDLIFKRIRLVAPRRID